MAAVLYTWENSSPKNGNAIHTNESFQTRVKNAFDHIESISDSIEVVVSQADEETVRKFLMMILKTDEKLRLRFEQLISPSYSESDMKKYKKQIDHTAWSYSGREGFISYYEADGFIRELLEYLHDDVGTMIDNQCYLGAFELTNYILVTAGNVDIDDSVGGTGEVAEECYEIWLNLLEKVDSEDKRKMYQSFVNHLGGSIIDYLEDYIERILMENFLGKEFIEKKLELTNQKVGEIENASSSYFSTYKLDKWTVWHLKLMEQNGNKWKELEEYCKKHWSISEVRKYYINECLRQKDYDKAIKVLKESLALDATYAGLVKNHHLKLKEIYELTDQKEEYLDQLFQLIKKDVHGDIDSYRELKAHYPKDEWVEIREKLLADLPASAPIDRFYKEEKLYDRLLDYVQKSNGLRTIQTYENILKKDHPAEILGKYAFESNKMAVHPSGRNYYKQLVFHLSSMKKISGGDKMVKSILKHWQDEYKNRPAMMDELNRLK